MTTPRPWLQLSDGSATICAASPYGDEAMLTVADCDCDPRIDHDMTAVPNAELIVRAVNSFGEGRELLREAAFLVNRLNEWSNDHLTDENCGDWLGHVEPSIARLTAYLEKENPNE